MGLFKPLTTLLRRRPFEDSTQPRSFIPYLSPAQLRAISKGKKNELLSDTDSRDHLLSRIRGGVVDGGLHSPSNPLLYGTPSPTETIPHFNKSIAISKHILALEAEIIKLRRESKSWADDFGEVQMELLEMRGYLYAKQMEVERLEKQAKIDAAEIHRLSFYIETRHQSMDVTGTSTGENDSGDGSYVDGKSVLDAAAGDTNTKAVFRKISAKIQSWTNIARLRRIKLPLSSQRGIGLKVDRITMYTYNN